MLCSAILVFFFCRLIFKMQLEVPKCRNQIFVIPHKPLDVLKMKKKNKQKKHKNNLLYKC